MANNNFETILHYLDTTNDQYKLLKLLIELRKQVEWPKHKENIANIRKKGSLKHIVGSLNPPKKCIIDVSLSILGNCCLDAKCARDVISQFNILPNLNQILKRYPKEDSINGRVFRIIGNICQHRDQWANTIIEKKPQVIIHSINFLKEVAEDDESKISEATIIMGVRLLRELVNRQILISLVDTYRVMSTVGLLMIKFGPKWNKDKSNEAIIVNLIKLLLKYSSYRYYPAILELRNTSRGDSITYLSKIVTLAPKQVVKIVMNFLNVSQLMSDLPVPEIFQVFIDILEKHLTTEEFNNNSEEYIRCMCKLLEHSANRNSTRCGESIRLLIDFLRIINLDNNNKTECCILILTTLNRCRYNEHLVQEQIRHNIIKVLVDKLIWIVDTLNPLKIAHAVDKKRRNCEVSSDEFNKKLKTNSDSDSEDSEEDEQAKPEHSLFFVNSDLEVTSRDDSDTMSCTSGVSPDSSPCNKFKFSESDSDDYSPVCSDVDEDDSVDPEFGLIERDEFSENEENVVNSIESTDNSVKRIKAKLLMEIVKLLKTFVKVKPAVIQLGNPELLLCLMKSSWYFDWPLSPAVFEIIGVVYKILDLYDYLLPLMKTNFIPLVYDLADMQHGNWCFKCQQFQSLSLVIIDKLSKLAESGAGRGDIAHKLLRGDSDNKQLLVVVLPYIIMNRSLLVKLMLNCGGLEVLLKLLQGETDLKDRSIKALYLLAAKRLNIINPKSFKNSKISLKMCAQHAMPETSQIVTFKLDDGSLLRADRSLLSQHSDFFSRLLNGDFKESTENEISLHNVVNKSLKCLLHLIKCDIDKSVPVEIDVDLVTHLDLIVLCDRFLMTDYCVYLTNCVEKYRFASDTVPVIYQWSIESRTNLLRVECVAYALVAKLIDTERLRMFKSLFDLGYTDELIGDIRTVLVQHLNVSPNDYKKKRKRFKT